MTALILHDEHQSMGARFLEVNGAEWVAHYGDPAAEYAALRTIAGLLDLSGRGRLVVAGQDRQRFLNGQVTNNVKDLRPGEGCYAAVLNAKGRIQGDLNIYCLSEELLLDCEPGHGSNLAVRLERFIVADDVQVKDIGAAYGLLGLQGPQCATVMARAFPGRPLPEGDCGSSVWPGVSGEFCAVNRSRSGLPGLELFVPRAELLDAWRTLAAAVAALGGRPCGWESLEWARIEAGLPRYGQDMDERNLAPETGIEARAISYTKGCYLGQEIVSRLRSIGQVTRSLRGLELEDSPDPLPRSGDRLTWEGREVGYLTSAIHSPGLGRPIGLGYVRREVETAEAGLEIQTPAGPRRARLRALPFVEAPAAQPASSSSPPLDTQPWKGSHGLA
jgi:folate-binding protein YgfZ